jgi:hypothetical protein
MGLSDDPWIYKNSPLAPEKLHAIGYIVTIWNTCEHYVETLFSVVAATPHNIGHAITHDLGSVKLFDTILVIAHEQKFEPDLVALLEHAKKLYEACRLNRNQVCHFGICGTPEGNRMARRKGPALDAPLLPDSIEDIRRVGDEIKGLLTFLQEVVRHLVQRQQGQPTPSPDRPSLPRALVSSGPPRENSPRPRGSQSQHPHRSSRA